MTSRERVLAALTFREADRIAIHDSPWKHTIDRWHREGLPEDKSPAEYFGYEFVKAGADTSMRLPTEIIEETDEYTITRNANGAVRRGWKDHEGTPELIDFSIKTRRDWDAHKHLMQMSEDRVNLETARAAETNARQAGKWFSYSGVLGYDKMQGFVGSVNLLMAIVDEPDWVADMFMNSADLIVETADLMISSGIEFDGAFLYDDLGYRNTSLFSPRAYRDLLFPAHRKAFQYFRQKGLPVILHSCGCVKGLAPQLIEAGLSCLQPLEVKAGMDLVELKQKHGDQLAFMGGIDVRAMANPDPAVIEKEISTKIPVGKKGGGYIYHSDHSVPSNVSFEQYCRVMELVEKYGRF